MGKKVILVRPTLDYELARHSKEMSLASFASITLCKPVFNLSDTGVSTLRHIDTRPSWHAEFLDPSRGKAAMEDAFRYVETAFQKFDRETETDLGAWLFTISAGATAYSLYETETPWFYNGLMDDF